MEFLVVGVHFQKLFNLDQGDGLPVAKGYGLIKRKNNVESISQDGLFGDLGTMIIQDGLFGDYNPGRKLAEKNFSEGPVLRRPLIIQDGMRINRLSMKIIRVLPSQKCFSDTLCKFQRFDRES